MLCSPVTPQSRGTLSSFSCRASSELPILPQPSFLQKMGLSPGKLTSSLHCAGPATFSDAAVWLWPTGSFHCIKDLSIYKSQVLKCFWCCVKITKRTPHVNILYCFEMFCFDAFTFSSLKDGSQDSFNVLCVKMWEKWHRNIGKLYLYFIDLGSNYKLKIEN